MLFGASALVVFVPVALAATVCRLCGNGRRGRERRRMGGGGRGVRLPMDGRSLPPYTRSWLARRMQAMRRMEGRGGPPRRSGGFSRVSAYDDYYDDEF